jgi:hypothetical protein
MQRGKELEDVRCLPTYEISDSAAEVQQIGQARMIARPFAPLYLPYLIRVALAC